MIVASYAAVPIGMANQRSLFAKRGKVNDRKDRWIEKACLWVGDMFDDVPCITTMLVRRNLTV